MPFGGIFDFENKSQRLEEVNGLLEDPKVWDDNAKSQKLGKEKRELELVINTLIEVENGLKDAQELFEMAREENDDDTLLSVAADSAALEKQIAEMEFRRMFSGELDAANCFVEFQSGSGGTEAQDWANMLLRMYLRYCERKGFKVEVLVAAPGVDSSVHEQNAATPLTLQVHRQSSHTLSAVPLPDPLGEVVDEFTIAPGTARSYAVAKGQYIQIIDVAGRQCSDFVAFNRRALERGIEQELDPTVTRTLGGRAYPGPGLHSRFFDRDMQPMLELVQDTVGRHDTFGLACAARYYESMGYFGHANCSDNLSRELAPYGVRARPGWPAINFFYNTGVDAHDQLTMDEPWSRPGDHVLLRALDDLVCANTSCPDDIDPANGWMPTDIHVRSYAAQERFSMSIAHRPTPDAEAVMTRESGFHSATSALTRQFSDYRGWWTPMRYDGFGAVAEYHACREQVVVMDLSALRKFEIIGPDAEALMQYCLTRDIKKLAVGQVVYSAMCYPHGGMLDDGTLLRLGPDNFRWICGEDYSGIWLREQAAKLGMKVWVKSASDHIHNVAVQGPRARELLRQLVWSPGTQPALDQLGWFRFLVGRLDDHNGCPIMVSRTGYTGELGYEVWCHPDDAARVWARLWELGQPLGLAPLGLDALDTLRIEAGLVFAGHEFSDQTDPFEAGIGFCVPLKS